MRRNLRFEKWENPFGDDSEMPESIAQNFIERNFNIWVLHTNFEMNEGTVELLWGIAGVEDIEPVTRYRLKIAIGRLFNEDQVKKSINRTLLFSDHQQLTLTTELKTQVDRAADVLKDYPFWIIMVLPNGRMETASAQGYDLNFEHSYELFRETQRAVGAYVEAYDDREVKLGASDSHFGRNYTEDGN